MYVMIKSKAQGERSYTLESIKQPMDCQGHVACMLIWFNFVAFLVIYEAKCVASVELQV